MRGPLAGTLSALASPAHPAMAFERVPYAGELPIRVPWKCAGVDPYSIDDPLSALLSASVTETLFGSIGGRVFPTLARDYPALQRGLAVINLRPGLVTRDGHRFTAEDAARSIGRARKGAAAGLLAGIEAVTVDAGDPLKLNLRARKPEGLAELLSNPVCAMTERGFSPSRHRGLGAFTLQRQNNRLVLERNPMAARGPAFLDSIRVEPVPSLGDGLAAFEAGDAAIGWFGKGLYRPRKGQETFNVGTLGWVVLQSGAGLGSWGAPGVVQTFLDGLDLSGLQHLGVQGEKPRLPRKPWGGPSAPILVDAASPQLVEIAQVLSRSLSQPGHELAVNPVAVSTAMRAHMASDKVLGLYFVRQVSPRPEHALTALLTALDPNLAIRPPKLPVTSARDMARTLSLGVVGNFTLSGAFDSRYAGLSSLDFPNVWVRE